MTRKESNNVPSPVPGILARGLGLVVMALFWGAVFPSGGPQYVGAMKCKPCHLKQFKIWDQSPHKTALEKLSREDRQKEKCVTCHVTGPGEGAEGSPKLEGVQCEACHGPGSLYRKMTIMSKAKYKADPDVQRKLAVEAGLALPTESTCTKCHNEKSPNFKGFHFEEAKEKIRHWDLD